MKRAARRIVLLGPPGAGKATQGTRLSEWLGIEHIDAGGVVRRHIADGTHLGRRAAVYVDRQELLPDEMMIDILCGRLMAAHAAGGYILDGFPRQIQALRWLQAQEFPPDLVIHLHLHDAEGRRRLALRNRSPDDSGAALQRRQRAFECRTRVVVDRYAVLGILAVVDAAQPRAVVTECLEALVGKGSRRAPRDVSG